MKVQKGNVGQEEHVSVTSTLRGCKSYFSSSTPFPSGRRTLPSQGICHWDTLQILYHTSHTASHNLQINMRSNVTQSHKSALAVLKSSDMEQAGTLFCFFLFSAITSLAGFTRVLFKIHYIYLVTLWEASCTRQEFQRTHAFSCVHSTRQ